MANILYIPELNPVIFYDTTRANLPKFFTKNFEDYPFEERLYFWQQPAQFKQVWQTDDIIFLQFESSFDPLIVRLVDEWGQAVADFPALLKIANPTIQGLFAFEVQCSLADLPTGCYRLLIFAGSEGPMQKVYVSNCQYISSTPLENTVLIEYWNSSTKGFHRDVMFVTGIKFQIRLHGAFGFLDKPRADIAYRDENYNPTLLNSRSAKQWPLFLGDFYGLPDDMINIIDHIFSCNNVRIDNKSYGIADGSKMEFVAIDLYAKRGVKLTVEAGINRNSRIFAIDVDTTKKLITTIEVEAQVFGDLSGQGSSNTIPTINAIPEL